MHQINKKLNPLLLARCYFGEGSACPGVPDQTQLILHDLTKAFMISNYLQKMNITPQIVFEKLKFKKSYNLIVESILVHNLRIRFFSDMPF